MHQACSGIAPYLSTSNSSFGTAPPPAVPRSYHADTYNPTDPSPSGGDTRWPPSKILFPSLGTVKQSIGGPEGGGTIFCNWSEWGKDPDFPRHLFHDSRSKRAGVLQHTKVWIFVARCNPR